MSIQLEMTVTGTELARALLRDEEEFGYALKEMADLSPKEVANLGDETAGYLSADDQAAVASFLRGLADAIEAAP